MLFNSLVACNVGFKIQLRSPLQVLQGIWSPVKTQDRQDKMVEFDSSNGSSLMSEATQEAIPVTVTETGTSGKSRVAVL